MAKELDLHIPKRLQGLLPPLTDEERQQLEENLLADKEKLAPICIWHDGEKDVIVDGMHSWPIVKKHKLSYRTRVMKFADYDEAELWLIRHQLGTRGIDPDAAKKLRGTLYNKLKQPHGGQTPEEGKYQIDTSLLTRETVAAQTGVSPATIARDGAFVDELATLETDLQKAIAMRHIKLSAPELKRLASLSKADQNAMGTVLRKGLATTLAEGFTKCGIIKAPPKAKPKATKPPKQYDRSSWFKQWEQSIGPICRLVDKIANELGESKSKHQNSVQAHLNHATEAMMDWLGVKK